MKIDDAFLYKYMPAADRILMAEIPPEEELDHKFSWRFRRKMNALLKYERRTPGERKFYFGMKIAFAALAVILIVAFSSVMSVKAYRFRIIDFFVEVFEDLTSYSAQEEKPTGEIADPVEPKYVPDGFEVMRRIENNQGYSVWYVNGEGDIIDYRQSTKSAFERLWDTETSVTSETYINKQKVRIIEEIDMYIGYWSDDEYAYRITGPKSIGVEELLKIVSDVIRK